MRLNFRTLAALVFFLASTQRAESAIKHELEFSYLYLQSTDSKAEFEDETYIVTDSNRSRSGGTAPGIFRYNLLNEDWYFTADFYNIFISGGSWGSMSAFKNGWGLTSEFNFGHSRTGSSTKTKGQSGSSSAGSSSINTDLAVGPAYLFQNADFRVEAAIRYLMQKGNSSELVDNYYEQMKLTGYDLVLKMARFYSITDALSVGYAADFRYLLAAKAEISENYPTKHTFDFNKISYVSTMVYPLRLQLKF